MDIARDEVVAMDPSDNSSSRAVNGMASTLAVAGRSVMVGSYYGCVLLHSLFIDVSLRFTF